LVTGKEHLVIIASGDDKYSSVNKSRCLSGPYLSVNLIIEDSSVSVHCKPQVKIRDLVDEIAPNELPVTGLISRPSTILESQAFPGPRY